MSPCSLPTTITITPRAPPKGAEITVMQFTGHSLLVHQFVTVPWDFNPVPYYHPSSPTPMEYAISAVFGMACFAGLEVNIQQYDLNLSK